ncbi:DUF4275 family protein [Pleionea sediminis]|uniref:DUF4275 family protein n=1 Tax=Pleionea sediminis TaxID=2569479 RepID=UPI0013DE13D4|nr:DUF4275 family protein [Pleionea sediminis]
MSQPEYTVEPGKVIRVYNEAETREIEANWIRVYCKDKSGANIKAYHWHIFSFKKYLAVEGEEAEKEYLSRLEPEYIILPNDGELAIVTNELPKSCSLSDYLVFPKNMSWTMARTHEEGWLGPYFAKHKNYKILDRENKSKREALLKKHKEIQNAKLKGWM